MEIDHVLVGGRLKLVQNLKGLSKRRICRDRPKNFRDYDGIQFMSCSMAPSDKVRLDVRRLRDEDVAQEYEQELAELFGELNNFDDPENLCTGFKTQILKLSSLRKPMHVTVLEKSLIELSEYRLNLNFQKSDLRRGVIK